FELPGGAPHVRLLALDGQPLPAQDFTIANRTYNQLSLQVSAADAAQVEWRDAYFPYWRAWVNGAEVSVERTAQGMKAVRVPAGRSEVVLRFRPAALRATMAI